MRRAQNDGWVYVGGSNSWQHIWDCICLELGIEEA